MRILSIQIKNYKSFRETEVIELARDFNVIVGENNVGKTAFVEAASTRFEQKPHRSTYSAPTSTYQLNSSSEVIITVSWEKSELEHIIISSNKSVYIPLFINLGDYPNWDEGSIALLNIFLNSCTVEYTVQDGKLVSSMLVVDNKPNHIESIMEFRYDNNTQKIVTTHQIIRSGGTSTILDLLGGILQNRLHFFTAERMKLGEAPVEDLSDLKPDASNLAEVLHHFLNTDSTLFGKFNQMVTKVIPSAKKVLSPKVRDETFYRIYVSSEDYQPRREDLEFQLSENGSGIGQVLTILYVVINSPFPSTIIIDEPQSFLHPGAIRRLFAIFKENSQHQYIITTHSPVALSALDSPMVYMIRKPEAESKVEPIDMADTQELQGMMAGLGVSLSDVFGAEQVLWVEGSTEEKCFPLIVKQILRRTIADTAIVSVLNTGDLEGKDSERVFRIYTQLSTKNGLWPRAVGYIFDAETRAEEKQEDMNRQGMGTVRFLSRHMYENYLLHPDALAAMLTTKGKVETNSAEIQEWLDKHKWDKTYFDNRDVAEEKQTDKYWLTHVHGAKLIKDIIKTKGQEGAQYNKVQDGLALTKWVLEHRPDDLKEVADILREILDKKMD